MANVKIPGDRANLALPDYLFFDFLPNPSYDRHDFVHHLAFKPVNSRSKNFRDNQASRMDEFNI